MNLLLLVGTVLGTGALLLAALMSLFMAEKLRAAALAAIALAWGLVYAAGVIVVSMASHEAVLPPGQTKHFCGFYLDCHVGVAVESDSVAQAIGGRRASGTFHVVTLRFSSNARQATLSPWRVRLMLEGSDRVRYERDLAAEAALASAGALEREIPAGGSYTVRVVFDVPKEALGLRLFAEQGPALKFPEIGLIGDEASVLHRKTYLALPTS